MEITDFDDRQANQFVQNWFQSFINSFDDDVSEEVKIKKRQLEASKENLIRQLNAQSIKNRTLQHELGPLKDLTQTPLLLTMLCLVAVVDRKVPSSYLDLYRKAVDILLGEWDAQRGIKRPEYIKCEDVKEILSHIAISAHKNNTTIISQMGN